MKTLTTNQIRDAFLNFYQKKKHTLVESSSLIPSNDPTLLFVNAGMVQFKDVFLGRDKRNYNRATSSQRCVRAGGKHNDLENVGYTARHHTLFEMLGNFSFGDYFKREAIKFAWELITEELQLPKEKLWVTVFRDDDEAADIWINEIGFDPARISRCDEKDNFWSMGDTGPCGPCSEIFFDHGPSVAGGPPGTPEEDGDRYIEIWNLVFMQYNRGADGVLVPLPKPSVDTGMGLERIAAVMQGVHSNYEIDLFQHLLAAIDKLLPAKSTALQSKQVIADHIRSCSFLIADGVNPSNEGRGYVLRRIIRRAVRHGSKLGLKEPFFHRLVEPLAQQMGEAYPELVSQRAQIEQTLLGEEQQFAETLVQGLKIFEQSVGEQSSKQIAGEVVFKLYDTYGFPMDLTADIARERGLEIDEAGFEACMQEQRARSKQASHFDVDYNHEIVPETTSEFLGYKQLEADALVTELFVEGRPTDSVSAGQNAWVVCDATPFYAESGGQVGDRGTLRCSTAECEVTDTKKLGQAFGHCVKVVSGTLKKGERVTASVAEDSRVAIMANHSATHLMHAALREVLGEHVQQKGSLVDSSHLRFDFTHTAAMTATELEEVERLVNAHIRANHNVDTKVMTPDEAKAKGAMALFGEKYGESVRVLTMSPFSIELCGGTHVCRTGDIGTFKITSEGGVAAGVRRIEAVTGAVAIKASQQSARILRKVEEKLKASQQEVEAKLSAHFSRLRELEKSLEKANARLAGKQGGELVSQAVEVAGVKVLAVKLEGVDSKSLRELLDQLKQKIQTGVVVLAMEESGKVKLISGVTADLTSKLSAGELIATVAESVGGRGGGRRDMAQAGGAEPQNIDKALGKVADWVKERLS